MTRQEPTARINRDELLGLLDTMHPTEQQPVTARVRISDIQAAAAQEMAVTLAEPAVPAVAKGTGPRRTIKHTTPRKVREQSVDAAKMQLVATESEVTKTVDVSDLLAALKAVEDARTLRVERLLAELQAIADAKPLVRAELDELVADARLVAEAPGERMPQRLFNDVDWDEVLSAAVSAMITPSIVHDEPWFPTLSPQIAAALSGEEISMLPMDIRLRLPDIAQHPFPRIEMTPLPGNLSIKFNATPREVKVEAVQPLVPERNVVVLVGYFAAACLAGFGAVYCLI